MNTDGCRRMQTFYSLPGEAFSSLGFAPMAFGHSFATVQPALQTWFDRRSHLAHTLNCSIYRLDIP
jgi:hypothetical protein